jgi:hypothetical protein
LVEATRRTLVPAGLRREKSYMRNRAGIVPSDYSIIVRRQLFYTCKRFRVSHIPSLTYTITMPAVIIILPLPHLLRTETSGSGTVVPLTYRGGTSYLGHRLKLFHFHVRPAFEALRAYVIVCREDNTASSVSYSASSLFSGMESSSDKEYTVCQIMILPGRIPSFHIATSFVL